MSFLINKVVFITGAANGIGAQLVEDCLKHGASVYACDIDLQQLNKRFRNKLNCTLVSLNVTSYTEWEALFDKVEHVDYLLNVAGIIRAGYIGETEKNYIDQQIDVNLKGTIYGSKLFVRKMLSKREGHIINFSSMAGIAPIPGISIYSASKFGVRGFTLALANELKDSGLKASVVCPDATETKMLDDQVDSPAAAMTFSTSKILTVEEVSDVVLNTVMKAQQAEVWIPFLRGVQAYLGATFPKLANWMSNMMVKQGLKNQKAFKSRR